MYAVCKKLKDTKKINFMQSKPLGTQVENDNKLNLLQICYDVDRSPLKFSLLFT